MKKINIKEIVENLISTFLNTKIVYKFFGWLNPKLVFIAEKE